MKRFFFFLLLKKSVDVLKEISSGITGLLVESQGSAKEAPEA